MLASWAARAVLAAMVMTVLELSFVWTALPATGSSLPGLAALLVDLFALFCVPAAYLALLGWVLEQHGPAWRLPDPARLAATVLGLVGTGAAIAWLRRLVAGARSDFPESVDVVHDVAIVGLLALGLGLSWALLSRLVQGVIDRAPRLGQPRPVALFFLACAALGALALCHLALFPIHQPVAAAWAGLVAMAAVVVAVRLRTPRIAVRWRRAGALLLGAAVLLPLAPWQSAHARFVLFGHAPVAGRIAMVLRDAVDLDRDGAAPRWLGGTDCAGLDPGRAPTVREIPEDGIDQDCRGGDATAPEPYPAAGRFPGCGAPPRRLSVLWITIDAWRHDAFDELLTPQVAAFARRAIVFRRAYAPTPRTKTTVASLLAGRVLSDLRPDNALVAELELGVTIAQRMGAAGMHTAAFNYFVLDQQTQAGFTSYNAHHVDSHPFGLKSELVAASITNGTLGFVAHPQAQPFFVWVHYPDTHAPYLAPAPPDAPAGGLRAAYERTLIYVDRQVGRLLGGVERMGLLDSTMVVVSADHGEALGQRGRQGHGANLFEETIRVPLVVWIPGCAPRVVDRPVNLVHLGATVSAWLPASVPGPGWSDPDPHELPVVVEASYDGELRRAIVGRRTKLLVDVRNGGRMLFDLHDDPAEAHNLYGSRPERRGGMEQGYQRWLDRPGAR